MNAPLPVLGGVEAGGTKVVCAVSPAGLSGASDGQAPPLLARAVVPTTTPAETLSRVTAFFAQQRAAGRDLVALGVASFGPLDLDPASPGYGRITTTPKPGWAGTDVVGPLRAALGVPIALATDVTGAAQGEVRWGAGRGVDSLVYLTVGTGIGGGAVVAGRPLGGALHPEMGHLHVERHPEDDYAGGCPFHGACAEGLASGPALRARFGRPAEDLRELRGRAVEIEAWYLAQLVTAVTYLLTPERIVLGGGVLGLDGLLPAVRAATVERLAGALTGRPVVDAVETHVVTPALGDNSGVLGALALAEAAVAS